MIEPTVGRILWYRPVPGDILRYNLQPLAAIITYVHNISLVNLTVFDTEGFPQARPNVYLRHHGGPVPAGSYCEWPENRHPRHTGPGAIGDLTEIPQATGAVGPTGPREPYDPRW